MHALRKYLQDGLDARAWQQADLMRASGLTRQRLSQMLGDDRDVLPSVPRRETLQAIARAFRVSESTVTAVAFEAMGYDLEVVRSETDLSTATDEQLVHALADRLGVGLDSEGRDGHGQQPAPMKQPPADKKPTGGVVPMPDRDSATESAVTEFDPEKLGLAARRTGEPNLGERLEEQGQQRE